MTAFLDRIRYWLGKREPRLRQLGREVIAKHSEILAQLDDSPDYLADFGPNVPVEDLGGKPVYYENNQPVYPEKAP